MDDSIFKNHQLGLMIFIFSLFLATSANSQNDTAFWRSLRHNNYSIKIPDRWVIDSSGFFGASFFIFSPKETENDNFLENVNIQTMPLEPMLSAEEIHVEDYVDRLLSEYKRIMTDIDSLEQSKIRLGQSEYFRIRFTARQGTTRLAFEQRFIIVDDSCYILTLTTEWQKSEALRAAGEQILNTFRVL